MFKNTSGCRCRNWLKSVWELCQNYNSPSLFTVLILYMASYPIGDILDFFFFRSSFILQFIYLRWLFLYSVNLLYSQGKGLYNVVPSHSWYTIPHRKSICNVVNHLSFKERNILPYMYFICCATVQHHYVWILFYISKRN